MKDMERRTARIPLEVRTVEGTSGEPVKRQLVGYANKFNTPSGDMGGWVEEIAPGAFAKSLAVNDVRAFFNHDFGQLLGRKSSGTLKVFEDEIGLAFILDRPDTTLGNDLYTLVSRGDLDGVSFGFYSVADRWSDDGSVNTILEADLVEISPVVFPAYESSIVEARSARLSKRPDPKAKARVERAKALILMDEDNDD